MAQEGLKHRTIKSYLSGLRLYQIHQNLGNPLFTNMPRLEYVLSGVKRAEAHAGILPRPRLPITLDILLKLKTVWLAHPVHPDNIMLWAAACTGFFGFLRAGEFTVPSPKAYDPEVHLSLADVAIDSHESPSLVRLRIKQSKTDPFRLGVDVFLGTTGSDVCPVKALIEYISVRSSCQSLLFIATNGDPLTRSMLVSRLQAALREVGVQHSNYNGHSFRIGAATTAAQRGLEDSLIQTLGRWKSAAYKLYIKLPRTQLASVSRVMACPPRSST